MRVGIFAALGVKEGVLHSLIDLEAKVLESAFDRCGSTACRREEQDTHREG